MIREINETPINSTCLNDNFSIKRKDKKLFIVYLYHKNYREIKGKIFRIRKYNKKLNKIGKLKRHTKNSCDSMSRKIKSWVIVDLIKFINKKLKKRASTNEKIRFYILDKEVSYDIKVLSNRYLLDYTVERILSKYYISKKTKNKNIEHNYNIIQKIKGQNNDYQDIKNILGLKFFVCIKHYIGEEKINFLEGFEFDNKRKSSISEYFDKFKKFVKNMKKYYDDSDFRKKMKDEMK